MIDTCAEPQKGRTSIVKWFIFVEKGESQGLVLDDAVPAIGQGVWRLDAGLLIW